MNKRKLEEQIFRILMVSASGFAAIILLLILFTIFIKGFASLSINMLIHSSNSGFYVGGEGGILNAIIGSLVLGLGASVIAAIISLPVAVYLNVHLSKGARLATLIRFSFDVLWGIPSIVYGAFMFTIMIFFGLHASLLTGIITVSLLMIPIMTRTMDEALKMIPNELKEASYSLGATKYETAFNVIVRQAYPGILTGVLTGFGRGIGDAASVLFTAGYSDKLPTSLFGPVATLPLAIFFQLGTPFPEVQQRGYASAFVLTIMILLINIASRRLSKKYTKHIIK